VKSVLISRILEIEHVTLVTLDEQLVKTVAHVW